MRESHFFGERYFVSFQLKCDIFAVFIDAEVARRAIRVAAPAPLKTFALVA